MRKPHHLSILALSVGLFLGWPAGLVAQAPTAELELRTITFQVEGMTQEWALRTFLADPSSGSGSSLQPGARFETLERLQQVVEEHLQGLRNLRVFNSVEAELQPVAETSPAVFNLLVKVKDSWTLVPYPYPKYDQNIGLRLGLRVSYSNALGTLTDFYLNNSIDFDTEFAVQNWKVTSSLSNVKLFGLGWAFTLTQGFATDSRIENDITTFKSTSYNTSLAVNTSFPLPVGLSYGLGLSLSQNYGFSFPIATLADQAQILSDKEGSIIAPSHSLSWGGINWMGNLRRGFTVSASQNLSWVTNQSKVFTAINGAILWYEQFGGIFGLSTKFSGYYELDQDRNSVASEIRGVIDAKLFGNVGAFASLTATLSLLNLPGWFEAQGNLFIDSGAAKKRFLGLASTEFKYGVGAELLVFPAMVKSLILRASLGVDPTTYNPKQFLSLKQYEISLGTGFQY